MFSGVTKIFFLRHNVYAYKKVNNPNLKMEKEFDRNFSKDDVLKAKHC